MPTLVPRASRGRPTLRDSRRRGGFRRCRDHVEVGEPWEHAVRVGPGPALHGEPAAEGGSGGGAATATDEAHLESVHEVSVVNPDPAAAEAIHHVEVAVPGHADVGAAELARPEVAPRLGCPGVDGGRLPAEGVEALTGWHVAVAPGVPDGAGVVRVGRDRSTLRTRRAHPGHGETRKLQRKNGTDISVRLGSFEPNQTAHPGPAARTEHPPCVFGPCRATARRV